MTMRLAAALLCVATCLPAQTAVKFEVASVRARDAGAGESSDTNVLPGGRLVCRNVTVKKLLRNSFLVADSRISGTPSWVDSQSYDIDAKTAVGVEITRDNIQELIRSLLESRFQLKFHRESRETPVYELEAAKGGAKVTPHPADDRPSMTTNSNGLIVSMAARKLSMPDFAGSLARQVGRPVIDKTGLAGNFDFDLKWSTGQAADMTAPSIFTVLGGIGLRLVPAKAPVDIIVVDRIGKPSAN